MFGAHGSSLLGLLEIGLLETGLLGLLENSLQGLQRVTHPLEGIVHALHLLPHIL